MVGGMKWLRGGRALTLHTLEVVVDWVWNRYGGWMMIAGYEDGIYVPIFGHQIFLPCLGAGGSGCEVLGASLIGSECLFS